MYRFGFNHQAGGDIMATIRPPRARSTLPGRGVIPRRQLPRVKVSA